jgi:hypothetical protein
LQTSFDGAASWIDIANFHFTTVSATLVVNLSALTPVASFAPTDGSLAANTVKDGVLGSRYKIKYKSAGTYVGATTLQVDVFSNRLVPAS